MNRLEQLMNLYSEAPGDAFLLFAIAKEHEKTGQEAEALQWFLRLKAAHPSYVGMYYHLGKLYERLQDQSAAIATYREGMKIARAAKDQHALGELNGARLQIDEEEDWD